MNKLAQNKGKKLDRNVVKGTQSESNYRINDHNNSLMAFDQKILSEKLNQTTTDNSDAAKSDVKMVESFI
jgi:hypothetical protein